MKKRGNKGGAITTSRLQLRIDEIQTMLLNGASNKDVVAYGAVEGWNVTERQVFNYITKALEGFSEIISDKKEIEFAKSVNRLMVLWNKANDIDDIHTALNVQKELNKIMGFHQYNINIKTEKNIKFSFGEPLQQQPQPPPIDITPIINQELKDEAEEPGLDQEQTPIDNPLNEHE